MHPSRRFSATTSSYTVALQQMNYDTLTERERWWYNELKSARYTLSKRETEIETLRQLAHDWKTKALQYKEACDKAQQELQETQQFLEARHAAEIQALTKMHAEKMNETMETMLQLERQNERLQQESNQPDPCSVAEEAHRQAATAVLCNRQKTDDMILGINDMVNAIEDELSHMMAYRAAYVDDHQSVPSIESSISSSTVSSMEASTSSNHDIPMPEPSNDAETHYDLNPSTHNPSFPHAVTRTPIQRTERPRSQTLDQLAKAFIPGIFRSPKKDLIHHDAYPPTPTLTPKKIERKPLQYHSSYRTGRSSSRSGKWTQPSRVMTAQMGC
ncbi:uncharacterized protein BYT42DRAFT_605052 [Radiomyces spectabilis]|uniref:uncharacterized protein n=1 Tax=Radiomyces spectabilis TaxID=64574 RepID=UPI002220D800|nr:uncharacterized protein BYT42DRAFT_605052 [Radiomyces spectabilis]KAI8379748.1 hypothetical protein BYT42DRAFT_605052 [Radiomyces spectabilis]